MHATRRRLLRFNASNLLARGTSTLLAMSEGRDGPVHDSIVDTDAALLGEENQADNTVGMVATMAPSLYERPSFFRQTRRNKILKTVTERYVRDDLGLGFYYPDAKASKPKTNGNNGAVAPAEPRVVESAQELVDLLRQPSLPGLVVPHTTTTCLVVCDANVLLHNLDLLEQAATAIPNLVVPQTALLETRRHSAVAYDRAVALLRSSSSSSALDVATTSASAAHVPPRRCCLFFADVHHAATAREDEAAVAAAAAASATGLTPNDRNDARIRRVAEFYAHELQEWKEEETRAEEDMGGIDNDNETLPMDVRVVLLTDDADSRRIFQSSAAALQHSAEAKSVREYVAELERSNPGLSLSDWVAQVDTPIVAAPPPVGGGGGGADGTVPQKRSPSLSDLFQPSVFAPHADATALALGIQSGRYHRGLLRTSHTSLSPGGAMDDNDKSPNRSSAWVTIRRGDERVAVTIRGSIDLNRALDGDVVVIALHPLDKWINANTSSSLSTSQVKDTVVEKGGSDGVGIADETAEPTLSDMENVQDKVAIDDVKALRPTGHVVGILRRSFPTLIGSIGGESPERRQISERFEKEQPNGSTTCVFFPVDKKFPPILIRTSQRDRLRSQRIVVTMDTWPAYSPYPLGHYVRAVGTAGSKDVETQALLEMYNTPFEPFSAAVLSCLPSEDYKIELTPDRLDLRHLPVLSIDPPNCKDIDDALHCTILPNGNFQVGVHIADVTHYVTAGSAMDLEAANRSTSTYLVNKRLDMLPGLLTTDLCSLKGNVDRYAFSVLWEVTPQAEIVDVDFKKSVIHSIAALTYQQAQSMIEQPDDSSDVQACAVKRLAVLARLFRKRRIDAGALTLASPEVKFVLDSESLNPTDVQAYALLEANALVEEFMLLANVTVAKRILRQFPTLSVLRRHPSPNRAMFDSLIGKAMCRGFQLDIEDSKRLADSLDSAVDETDPYINILLRILSTRCMSPAQYFCSGEVKPQEWHHYGLAAPVYTHFTSPIRRYSDICVHRLLAAAIGVAPLPQHFTKSYIHDLCSNMNRRHRAAQLAGRASVQLHTLIFFAGEKGGKEEDAYVLDISTEDQNPSFLVMVPRYGLEGKIRLPNIAAGDPDLEVFPVQHKWRYRGTSIQVFDKVRVRIRVQEFEDNQRELLMDLVSPVIEGASGVRGRSPSLDKSVERKKKKKLRV